jgi:hypothetical protein
MQTFTVVDTFEKILDVKQRIFTIAIVVQIYFFTFVEAIEKIALAMDSVSYALTTSCLYAACAIFYTDCADFTFTQPHLSSAWPAQCRRRNHHRLRWID